MKKRRVLILGASLMQKPAILEAKKMGCEVVAVDANPKSFCVDLVDRFEKIDLKDVAHLVQFAKMLKEHGGLCAVFTAATDFSVSVASITEALHLPGHSLESAKNASDKARMRRCFLENKVASPSFLEIGGNERLPLKELSNFAYPLVVKPVDSMGARGCKLVKDFDCLELAIGDAVRYSRTGRAIVEEFVEGAEFSIEGLVFDGEVHITALADRHIYFSPYFVEMGHTIPSICDDDVAKKICEAFRKGVASLGLSHGACKGDVFFEKRRDRAVIGEIAARLSGGYMSGWTVPYSSNINVTRMALQLALGDKIENIPQMPTKHNTKYFVSERAYLSIAGKIRDEMGVDGARASENVKDVFSRIKKGDEVKFPQNNVEKCGNVISVSSGYDDALLSSRNAIKKIFLKLEPCIKETDEFLSSFNDDFEHQEEYPPNYFIFSTIKEGSITKELEKAEFIIEKNILCPKFFIDFLYIEREPMGESIYEALQKAFLIEPRIKMQLMTFVENIADGNVRRQWVWAWTSFIRGGAQGLVYWFDSYCCR